MGKIWRDQEGSVFVEYAVIFPLFMLVILGSVDVTTMLADFALANKAAYLGARTAIVSDPIATNITTDASIYSASQLAQIGSTCMNVSTGASTGACPATSTKVDCTSASCTPSTYGFTAANLTPIVTAMQKVYPKLTAANVTVSYQFNGAGYVGRPGGLPMNVTVSITNMTHQLVFMGPLLSFFGGPNWSSTALPAFASTLPSEDMFTN